MMGEIVEQEFNLTNLEKFAQKILFLIKKIKSCKNNKKTLAALNCLLELQF